MELTGTLEVGEEYTGMTVVQVAGLNYDGPFIPFTGVPVEHIGQVWAIVMPLIQKALDRFPGDITMFSIANNLQERKYQLWVEFAEDGELISVGITQIISYETYDAARLVLVAGKMSDNWHQHLDVISNWAAQQGCVKLETQGRLGWGKAAQKFGFEPYAILLQKDIETRH